MDVENHGSGKAMQSGGVWWCGGSVRRVFRGEMDLRLVSTFSIVLSYFLILCSYS